MGVVDTMMLGRLSEQALAAGALGNTVSFAFMSFGMGILMGLVPLISQAHGAGRHRDVAYFLRQGLILAILLSLPLCVILAFCRPMLVLFRQQPEIIDGATAYIHAVIPGVFGFLLFVALRQSMQALSIVRPALIAILLANAFNVVANYGLIFGHFGLPALGVRGSGWATTLSRWFMLIGLLWAGRSALRPFWLPLKRSPFRLAAYASILRIGIPVGVQTSLEIWLFAIVALMMGSLGARELAGHQIALQLASLSFMLPLGIAGAAATRVGNAIGRGDMPATRRAAAVSLVFGATVMTFSALFFWQAPHFLARLFTPDQAVVAMAASLLPIAALFQIFDGIQAVGAGVLRGAADTRFPAIAALFGYWGLGLSLAYGLAFTAGMGPPGLWFGLTAGLASVAILLSTRIFFRFRGEIKAV
jgi:MATE family multidrug resistance protein